MSLTRAPIDGLWRCLCPSFETFSISRPLPALRNVYRPRVRRRKLCPPSRTIHTATAPAARSLADASQAPDTQNWRTQHARDDSPRIQSIDNRKIVPPAPKETTLEERLKDVPIAKLHDNLKYLTGRKGAYNDIVELVEYLVTVREEKIGLIHFDALVRANSDAKLGSAKVVERLLLQMKEAGIVGDSAFYHGVLLVCTLSFSRRPLRPALEAFANVSQVLAIHPNYILRDQIIEEMKERWYGLSPRRLA